MNRFTGSNLGEKSRKNCLATFVSDSLVGFLGPRSDSVVAPAGGSLGAAIQGDSVVN